MRECIGRQGLLNVTHGKHLPEQIEEKLSHNISRRFYVKGLPEETLGEKLVVVIKGESYEVDKEVFARLGKFERPKEIIFIENFKKPDPVK